ncbi:GAF domain-containing protein [Streptomyces mirabilis]|uniref:GAF domain-containing protein n=1 Tax=Streptomyces mirabilis TaxID=68239 RepID=UPI0021C23136|nr:GAF domain-containing protein [Streptomyces mirabilis]MCT9107583.1 GAF domain-containing protein [Streptomyces mirabilis]
MAIDNGPDPDAARRDAALRSRGLHEAADAELDAIAAEVAQQVAVIADIPYLPSAMVNWRTADRQFFGGLHVATGGLGGATAEDIPRHMELEDGWCPKVVRRQKAYPLDDVRDSSRWAGNPVANALGVRAYLGAPIFDPDDPSLVLGSVCAVDTVERPWGREGLVVIKHVALELTAYVNRR